MSRAKETIIPLFANKNGRTVHMIRPKEQKAPISFGDTLAMGNGIGVVRKSQNSKQSSDQEIKIGRNSKAQKHKTQNNPKASNSKSQTQTNWSKTSYEWPERW